LGPGLLACIIFNVFAIICPDPPDLEPLAGRFQQFLIGASALLALQLVFPQWSARLSRFAPTFVRSLASRRGLCGLLLLFLAIALRVALLPLLALPVPGIHDEFSYLLMGDTFAHGRLSNAPHPMWMSFETFHVNWFPRYASMYPPAQGLVLAIGQRLGHPWIGVLLSSAAMCAVIYWMLLGWLPPRWALAGGMIAWLKFCVASYWVNSYWGGSVAAIGGALVLGAIGRLLKSPRSRDALLFSLGLAILANSRPYEGLIFSLPSLYLLGRWLLAKASASGFLRDRWRVTVPPIAAILLLAGAFMGFYHWRLTGHPLVFPHTLNVRTYHTAPMFLFQAPKPEKPYNNQQFEDFYNGWEREEYDHSWESVKCLTWLKSVRFFSAFAWWGMLLAVPALWLTIRDRRMRLAWITLAAVLIAAYAVVWSNAHYAAPITCVVILLYLQCLRRLRFMRWRRWQWGSALARASLVLLLVDTATAVVRKQCDTFYWTCQGDISRQTIQHKLEALPGKHLVVVRYNEDHNIHDEWVYNGAEIDSAKVVWAREIGPEQDDKLFKYFQDRKVWLVTPDTDNTYLEPYTPPGGSGLGKP
jgi:hypothetical protein